MSRHRIIRWCFIAALALGIAGVAPALRAAEGDAVPTTQVEQPQTGAAVGHEATSAAATHGDKAKGHGEAEGDPAGELVKLNPVGAIFTIAVFVVLVIVLRLTAWKPILSGLKSREDAIRNSIEAAAKAKADTERTTRELEAKMAEVQREGAKQLQQAKADAQKLADGIRAQAEAESAAMKERTLRDIEAAKQQALAEINGHAADLGVAVARKILQREVNVTDHARLVEESLAELGTAKV